MRNKIKNDVANAIAELQKMGKWPAEIAIPEIVVEPATEEQFGDYACNVAMQLAPVLKSAPQKMAEELQQELLRTNKYQKIEVAGPGFINFWISDEQWADAAEQILEDGENFGRQNIGSGQKVLIEYISANPTGPLTLPNGRGGFLGDVLSNIYEFMGFAVTREYYINDRGGQIDILGESVARRYLQLQGINVPYPDELYQGEYITELAKKIELKDYKLNNSKKLEWVKSRMTTMALNLMLDDIKRVVSEKMQVHYDNWFSEKSLYDGGVVAEALEKLRAAGYLYEKDGATWAATTKFDDEKDRVVVKSNGSGAYLQGDVALFYHRAVLRHIAKTILIIGADHHGFEKRMKAIPRMLGVNAELDLIFLQLVTLVRGGQEVRMSKRSGTFVTIEELIDEVGHDVTRFFFLMFSANRHMNFDLDLAKEQSENNPVFYVQYAHARICSILREIVKIQGVPEAAVEIMGEGGTSDRATKVVVAHPAERQMVKLLIIFPDLIADIMANYEVHHLTHFAIDLARAFHRFYDECRVIDQGHVHTSRYQILRAAQIVLQNTLRLMGVSAPERM